jgi:hypothetical protein
MGKWLDRMKREDEKSIQKLDILVRKKPGPIVRQKTKSNDSSTLNILAPDIKKKPQLHLLTEVELEAFNGWYSTMRKHHHRKTHEEANQLAWRFLIESMEIMYKEGRGRYELRE